MNDIDNALVNLLTTRAEDYIKEGYTEEEAASLVIDTYFEAKDMAEKMFKEAGMPL